MNRFLSQKLRFYSFLCISLLLFVHGYNLQETYLQPYSLVNEPTTFTTFFEYYVANGLLRFRIPLLFIISGYIFSLQDTRPYWGRIGKRFNTLMIPFFIWSAMGLLMTFIWQQFPVTARAVLESQLDQFNDNRPYSAFGVIDILKRWLLAPVSFQLWFIRSLFFYNMLYPLLKKAVLKFPLPWFVILFILTILKFGILFFEAQGMLFFSLGIWISKSHFPVERKPVWVSTTLCWLIFAGLSFIKTWMAFEFDEYNFTTILTMSTLHYISITSGIIAVWYSGDKMVAWCMSKKWFTWIASFSFIIYALHVPLLPYLTRIFYIYLQGFTYYRLFTFLVVPLIILLICIAVGAIWRKVWPSGYRVATGGRGF